MEKYLVLGHDLGWPDLITRRVDLCIQRLYNEVSQYFIRGPHWTQICLEF